MKKIVCFLLLTMGSLAFAEDMPIVCSGKIQWLKDEYKNEPRYFFMVASAQGDVIAGDAKTVDIDRKNKIIKIWTIDLYSYKSQAREMKKYGAKYSDLGYVKDFVMFDFANKKTKILHSSSYTCEGNIIDSSSIASDWGHVVPDSVGEAQLTFLKQKYGF